MKKLLALLVFCVCAEHRLSSQSLDWVKTLPGTYFDDVFTAKMDGNRNLYMTGMFSSSTLDVDPGPGTVNFSNAGVPSNNDFFIAKYDSLGNYVWAKKFGGPYDDICTSLQLDTAGNIYIAGHFG